MTAHPQNGWKSYNSIYANRLSMLREVSGTFFGIGGHTHYNWNPSRILFDKDFCKLLALIISQMYPFTCINGKDEPMSAAVDTKIDHSAKAWNVYLTVLLEGCGWNRKDPSKAVSVTHNFISLAAAILRSLGELSIV